MKIDEVDNRAQREDVDMIDAFKEKATIEIQSSLEDGRVTEEASHVDELDSCIIDDEHQIARLKNWKVLK